MIFGGNMRGKVGEPQNQQYFLTLGQNICLKKSVTAISEKSSLASFLKSTV